MEQIQFQLKEDSPKEKRILKNSIRTPDGTILESIHRHDFVSYKDKNGQYYAVDGGREYLKRSFDIHDFEELSVYDDETHENRRNNLRWGVNYDKDMNRLPEGTDWKLIKELNSEHIQAILAGGYAKNNKFYEDVFKEELKYRAIK